MRLVEYNDTRGKRRWAWVKETDPDSMAPHGIPADPPDIDQLDWDGIKNEVRDVLSTQGLLTWKDVERTPGGLSAAINVFKRYLIRLYRQA